MTNTICVRTDYGTGRRGTKGGGGERSSFVAPYDVPSVSLELPTCLSVMLLLKLLYISKSAFDGDLSHPSLWRGWHRCTQNKKRGKVRNSMTSSPFGRSAWVGLVSSEKDHFLFEEHREEHRHLITCSTSDSNNLPFESGSGNNTGFHVSSFLVDSNVTRLHTCFA